MEIINNKDITFVVQGPKLDITEQCVRGIRKYFPKSHIIFSTWVGTDISKIDCDEAVFNIDPGDCGDSFFPQDLKYSHLNNLNRQILTSKAGLNLVKTRFSVKVRSDFIFTSDKLKILYQSLRNLHLSRNPQWSMFKERILTFPIPNIERLEMAFHFGDLLQIGLTEDLLDLWSIPFITKADAQYCVEHNVYYEKRPRAYRYACEQEIWFRNLDKHKIKYTKPDFYYSFNDILGKETIQSFVNNLYWFEFGMVGVDTKFKWLENKNTFEYTFDDYYRWYNEYIGTSKELDKFYQRYQKAIEKKYGIKETKTKIKSKDVSVVIQGPVERGLIEKCIKSVRKKLPFSEIIISTWEGSDVKNLAYDKLILNKDPGTFPLTLNGINNNVNRQILSTQRGINASTRKYCLKLRSNAILENNNFLNLLNQYDRYDNKFHLLKHRLLIPSYFSRDPNVYKSGIYANKYMNINYPFHPSDMVLFGSTEDMKDYWNIPLLKEQDVKTVFKGIYGKYIPEQYIFIKFLEKKGICVNLASYNDNNPQNIEQTERFFASNFIMVDYDTFGIGWQTDKFSIFQNPRRFLSCYTPYKWKELYKKYCDSTYCNNFFDTDIFYIQFCLKLEKIRNLFKKQPKKQVLKKLENTILMPTYQGHFKFVKKFLKSADKFLLDKDTTEIVFVINKNEEKLFNKIINKYQLKLRLRIVFFDDVLKFYKIPETPEQILERYGRFTFQTLKKMCTMLFLNREDYLVLDSESLFVRSTNMKQLKQAFFEKPFILTSQIDLTKRNRAFMIFCENINHLIGIKMDKWPLEHFGWFYKVAILKDMAREHGSFYDMAKKIFSLNSKRESPAFTYPKDIRYGIFEISLYLSYIIKNNDRYKYQIKSVDHLLSVYLSEEEKQAYIRDFYGYFKGNCGLLEHAMLFLNKKNWKHWARLFKTEKIDIIRCEKTNLKLYRSQKKFLKRVKPYILAASQNHCFGMNNNIFGRFSVLVGNTISYIKLKKHIKILLYPLLWIFIGIKNILYWIGEIFSVLVYFIRVLIEFIKNLKIILFG